MKILIVEDDLNIRKLLVESLRQRALKLGVEGVIFEAGNLDDALKIMERERPELIFCDGRFPTRPDSDMAAESNKPKENWILVCGLAPKIQARFVLLSGAMGIVDRARSRGIEALLKPFNLDILEWFLKPVSAEKFLNSQR